MKKTRLLKVVLVISASLLYPVKSNAQHDENQLASLKSKELPFMKNEGQWDSRVKYRSDFGQSAMSFMQNGISFAQVHLKENPERKPDQTIDGEVRVWNLVFDHASPDLKLSGEKEVHGIHHFLSAGKSITHTLEGEALRYEGVYPNTDIRYFLSESKMKYDLILKPGASIEKINLKYEGIISLKINQKGELEINNGDQVFVEDRPFSYQLIDGQKKEVDVRYQLKNGSAFGFELIGDYNPDYELIIDPFMQDWGSYLRMTSGGFSNDVAMDDDDEVYLTGYTFGNYPIEPGVHSLGTLGMVDAWAAKLNSTGTALVYFTQFGGNKLDIGRGIDVNNSNEVFLTGITESPNFPVAGSGFGMTYGASIDGFACALNATGTAFIYSKFLNGSSGDYGNKVWVNRTTGMAYVVGTTYSNNFTVTMGTINGIDAFIRKIDYAGNLVLSRCYGGVNYEEGNDISVSGTGDIHIAGMTKSGNLPLAGSPHQNTLTDILGDGFVARFSSTGVLNYATYYGGESEDVAQAIDVNNSGNIFIAGWTKSTNKIATPGVVQSFRHGAIDCFVAKFNSFGVRSYGTYLGGGSNLEQATGIAANSLNEAFVTGFTSNTDFPLDNPGIGSGLAGAFDLFLTHLTDNGQNYGCGGSTYIGGSKSDTDFPRLALGENSFTQDLVALTATSYSANFPTNPGSYQPTNVTGSNAQPIASRIHVECPFCTDCGSVTGYTVSTTTICAGECLDMTASITGGYPTIMWLPCGYVACGATASPPVSSYYTSYTSTFCYPNPGTYTIAAGVNGGPPYSTGITITVLPTPTVSLGPDQVICPGDVITLTPTGYSGTVFLWDDGSTLPTRNITLPGTYWVEVTAINGCTARDEIVITTLANYLTNQTICKFDGVTLNAGPGGASYSWTPAAGLSSTSVQSPVASPMATTTYTVTVTYPSGCVNTGTVTVTVNTPPVVNLGPTRKVCEGSCINIKLPTGLCVSNAVWYYNDLEEAGPGAPVYTKVIVGTGTSLCIIPTVTTTYCVDITDCNGCKTTACILVIVVDKTSKYCRLFAVDDACCGQDPNNLKTAPLTSDQLATDLEPVFSHSVFPNPFEKSISFSIESDHDLKFVHIRIFNVLGELVYDVNESFETGTFDFEKRLGSGEISSDGVYYYTIETAVKTESGKLVRMN